MAAVRLERELGTCRVTELQGSGAQAVPAFYSNRAHEKNPHRTKLKKKRRKKAQDEHGSSFWALMGLTDHCVPNVLWFLWGGVSRVLQSSSMRLPPPRAWGELSEPSCVQTEKGLLGSQTLGVIPVLPLRWSPGEINLAAQCHACPLQSERTVRCLHLPAPGLRKSQTIG